MFFNPWRPLKREPSPGRGPLRDRPAWRYRPRLNLLEQRDCPAVTLVQKESVLFITGDLGPNAVGLVREANEVRVTLGDGRTETFANVDTVLAALGGGNDQMNALIIPPTPLSPNDPPPAPFALSARLGAGNDVFEAGVVEPPDPSSSANASIVLTVDGLSGDDRVFIRGGEPNGMNPLVLDELSVEVGGGTGADEVGIIIINSRIDSLSQKVRSGDGPDEVLCIIANSTVGPTSRIVQLGEGNDAAAIVSTTVSENMSLADIVPGGDEQFREIKARPDMTERPRFPAPLLHGGDVQNRLDALGGRDSVWLNLDAPVQVSDASFDVDLGSGNDVLSAGFVLRPLLIAFNPQPEPPVVRLGANVLAGIGSDLVHVEVGLVPIASDNIPDEALVVIEVAMNGGDGKDTLLAGMGVGPTPFVPGLDCNIEMLGGTGNDVLDLSLKSGPVPNDGIPGKAVFTLSMDGGAGLDAVTHWNNIMPTGRSTEFDITLVMNGGTGDDIVTLAASSDATDQKVATLNMELGGGTGDDRFIVMWDVPAFETGLVVDGGDGFDVCLHSDPARLLNVEVDRSI